MLTQTPKNPNTIKIIDFELSNGIGQEIFSYQDCGKKNGCLVMFICNHCPYVQNLLPFIKEDTEALLEMGFGSVAIMSNDIEKYPQDAPEEMEKLSKKHSFYFPYLYDKTQKIAKNYNAACTPEFFLLDNSRTLFYRGRLRGNENNQDLLQAAQEHLNHKTNIIQKPSIGCSIKWKTNH